MPFSHLPITSQDDWVGRGGLTGCSTEQMFQISEIYLTLSCDLKRSHNKSAKPELWRGTEGVHLRYTLPLFIGTFTDITGCQVQGRHCNGLCLPGVPKRYTWVPAVGPLPFHPVWSLISWKTATSSLAKWRECLARRLSSSQTSN